MQTRGICSHAAARMQSTGAPCHQRFSEPERITAVPPTYNIHIQYERTKAADTANCRTEYVYSNKSRLSSEALQRVKSTTYKAIDTLHDGVWGI